jgi:zinc transport system permease protein
MLDIFNYTFMIRALIAGGIMAIVAPLIGVFLVSKRYSLMADTLSHVCLAGVAIGLLTKTYPVYTALIVAVLAAIMIQKLNEDKKLAGESTLALFLSGGLALATVLIGFAGGFNVDLFSYLFGSITTVTNTDVYLTFTLGFIVVSTIGIIYKQLMYVALDEEAAKVNGIPVKRINYMFLILTAVTIALTIRIVGVLLVSALMVIPVLTASLVARSFKQTIFYAILFGLYFVILGLYISFNFDIAAGGSIVLFALVNFMLFKLAAGK